MTDSDDSASEKQWDPAAYDGKHSFVWKYGADLIELLAPRAGERILDLGCGTGHLTNKIAESGAEVIGIDKSVDMIEQAQGNYPALKFEIADGTNFHFEESFDAVFSNAAIHWMRDPVRVAACIWRALKPGGRFVAEFGGKGNIQALHGAVIRAITEAGYTLSREATFRYYPSIGEYATLLEGQGFRVTYALHFDRPTPLEDGEKGLENWVKVFANNFLEAVPPREHGRIIRMVEDELRPRAYRDGTWFADYRRLRVVAYKEQATG